MTRRGGPLRSHSELLRLAVGLGLDAPLAVWYCLRAFDQPSGRGWLAVNQALFDDLALEYGWAKSTLYRHLAAGEGLLWTRHGGRIFLHGLGRVTSALIRLAEDERPELITATQATASPAGRAVELLPAKLAPTASRRCAFFVAWVGVRCEGDHPEGVTASLETLARIWGVSERTIWAWGESPEIEKQSNWIHAPLAAADMVPSRAQEIETTDGPRLYWRGPSSYLAAPPGCRRGMAYRLAPRMAARGRPPVVSIADGNAVGRGRLFWRNLKAAQRARRPAEQVYYTQSGGLRLGSGRWAWRGRWWSWRCDLPKPMIRAAWDMRAQVLAFLGVS